MKFFRSALLASALLGLAGCHSPATRIRENPGAFAALDPATQDKIRRGEVEPGFTPEMVRLAFGPPVEVVAGAEPGDTTWVYRHRPFTAAGETVFGGYRRRTVYDPVLRTENVVVEPVDTKAFPQLAAYSLRLTFRDGKLAALRRVEEI